MSFVGQYESILTIDIHLPANLLSLNYYNSAQYMTSCFYDYSLYLTLEMTFIVTMSFNCEV